MELLNPFSITLKMFTNLNAIGESRSYCMKEIGVICLTSTESVAYNCGILNWQM